MNPLFRAFQRFVRDEAAREFRNSTTGQIIREIQRVGRSRTGETAQLEKLTGDLINAAKAGGLERQLRRTEAGRLATDIGRYASGGVKDALLNALFGQLGPLGDLFKSLLRPRGRALAGIEREIQAAHDLLRTFRPDLLRQPGGPRPRPARTTLRPSDAGPAQELLESMGFTVTPPGKRPETSPQSGPAAEPNRPRVLPGVAGDPHRTRRRPEDEVPYPLDDPIMTGEMIEVESSNVHSIGFIYDHQTPQQSTLKVRFWQNLNGTRSAGPTYYYYGIPPEMFQRFRVASSKGEWVWDNLRVRGSVAQHRMPYELKGISGGYVPRKATRYGPNEYYVSRRVRVRSPNGRQLGHAESRLPDQAVLGPAAQRARSAYQRPANPRGRR